MVRFVMSADGQLVADNLHRLPGRGAYRHASCMTKQVEAKIMYSLKKASIKKQKLRR